MADIWLGKVGGWIVCSCLCMSVFTQVSAASDSAGDGSNSCKEDYTVMQSGAEDAGFVFGTLAKMSQEDVDGIQLGNQKFTNSTKSGELCGDAVAKDALQKWKRSEHLSASERVAIQMNLSAKDIGLLRDQQRVICQKLKPQIHTIGWQSILTFEPEDGTRPTGNPRAARIQVQGQDLNPMCVRVDVQLTGTVPVGRYGGSKGAGDNAADYYVNFPDEDRSSSLNILLMKPYLDRVKTGDKLTVIVQVERYATVPFSDRKNARAFFARRTFTLYSTPDYRTTLAQQIRPDNFVAFPLPDDEAKALFGSYVRDNYYVVQLSVRNTDSAAKVISTGMIRANGTAIVTSADKSSGYSVPLAVAPQSLQQVYKAMTTKNEFHTRAWVFRSLEFGGALASGLSGVVNLGVQAVKGIGLFTGVALPEGRKLWPDTLGDHQENLVNFGMPELIKVAPNAVADNRFLFFPKKDISGALVDPSRPSIDDDSSRARLVEVRFDDLDIRYEAVEAIGTEELRASALSASEALAAQIAALKQYSVWISNAGKSGAYGDMDAASYTVIDRAISSQLAVAGITDNHKNLLTITKKYLQVLDGNAANQSNLYKDLYADSSVYSVTGLQKAQETLKTLSVTINAGTAGESVQANLKSISARAAASQAIQAYYLQIAATLMKINQLYFTKATLTDSDFTAIGLLQKSLDDARPAQATAME